MKEKKSTRIIFVVVILVISALLYYNHLSNKASNNKTEANQTELEKLISYDFKENYPKTVKETTKLHLRYLKFMYNYDITDDDVKALNSSMRNLFSDSLLAANSEEDQYKSLISDITNKKDNSIRIINYTTGETSQIKYSTKDGIKYALIDVDVYMKSGTASTYTYEQYLLSQSEDGTWKIEGWQLVNQDADLDSTTEAGDTKE